MLALSLAWLMAGCAGKLLPWASATLGLTVQIVRAGPNDQHTFQVLPRRWVVERTLAWITAYRRCARDYERLTSHHEAMLLWARSPNICLLPGSGYRPARAQITG